MRDPDAPAPATPASHDTRVEDLRRATHQVSDRLSALGIALDGSESSDVVAQIADAVERFEDAVEARGGDLMVDEPPRGAAGQADDPDFMLPRRAADETAGAYLERLKQATRRLREHPKLG
jgi:hypothetical protein